MNARMRVGMIGGCALIVVGAWILPARANAPLPVDATPPARERAPDRAEPADPAPVPQIGGGCCDTGGPCRDPLIRGCVCANNPACCGSVWPAACAAGVSAFGCGTCVPQACCFAGGFCLDAFVDACSGIGGSPQGPGTSCNAVVCDELLEACCFIDGTCADTDATSCFDLNGTSQGPGSRCATVACPMQAEACCDPAGNCDDLPSSDCFLGGGVPQGAGTTCSSVSCPPPLEACCLPNGACHDLTAPDCFALASSPQGAGTSCGTTFCPQLYEACCYPSGMCTDEPPTDCFANGGSPQGPGTTCSTVFCPQPNEACCYPNGSCNDQSPTECFASGGSPQGPGTTCSTVFCPQPNEACCYLDGSCNDELPSACFAQGGNPQGPGSSCATAFCPPPNEACCFADGSCADNAPANCLALGGTPYGPGSACSTTTCPLPTEACCHPDGGCTELASFACVAAGGTPQGAGTTCAGVTCPIPPEACCYPDQSCADVDYGTCVFGGGTPQGPGSDCENTDCTPPPGACCFLDGTCADIVAGTCTELGGAPQAPGTTCAMGLCPEPTFACCFLDGSCFEYASSFDCFQDGGTDLGPGSTCGTDANSNGFTDGCERDCNTNGIADQEEVAAGSAPDLNTNGAPDECDILECRSSDLNHNGIPDETDIAGGTAADANTNGILDETEQSARSHSFIVMDNGGNLRDDKFASLVRDLVINSNGTPRVKDVKFCFAQCFGGGMLDDIERELGDRVPWVAGSAARHDEVSWGEGDNVDNPFIALERWVRPLLGALGSDTFYRGLKRAARLDAASPRNRPRNNERPQYRERNGRDITLEDPAAQSHHALLIAGHPDGQRHYNDIRRMCERLEAEWGDLNTNGTSVHLLYGDGTANPCSSNGVPNANRAEATTQGFIDALNALRPLLNENEELFIFVSDHGDSDSAAVNTGGLLPVRGVPPIVVHVPVPLGYAFGIRRDPFNPGPSLRVIASGTYPPNACAVHYQGRFVGFLDPTAMNGSGQNETILPLAEGFVTPGPNEVIVDPAGHFVLVPSATLGLGGINTIPSPGWGDADGDGAADLADLPALDQCLAGPGAGLPSPGCTAMDIDADGDVDLRDAGLFQKVFPAHVYGN